MNFTSTHYFALLIVVVIALIVGLRFMKQVEPGTYDTFAQCLTDSGIQFYGAFWCPVCAEQKKMFGPSVKLLPYVECSLPDKKTQIDVCIEKEVKSYPTWILPDDTRFVGLQTFEALSDATGCELPT
jgi:hypothetical protein